MIIWILGGNFKNFIDQFKENIKFPITMLKYLPKSFIKRFIMYPLARSKMGPKLDKNNDKGKINAFLVHMSSGNK